MPYHKSRSGGSRFVTIASVLLLVLFAAFFYITIQMPGSQTTKVTSSGGTAITALKADGTADKHVMHQLRAKAAGGVAQGADHAEVIGGSDVDSGLFEAPVQERHLPGLHVGGGSGSAHGHTLQQHDGAADHSDGAESGGEPPATEHAQAKPRHRRGHGAAKKRAAAADEDHHNNHRRHAEKDDEEGGEGGEAPAHHHKVAAEGDANEKRSRRGHAAHRRAKAQADDAEGENRTPHPVHRRKPAAKHAHHAAAHEDGANEAEANPEGEPQQKHGKRPHHRKHHVVPPPDGESDGVPHDEAKEHAHVDEEGAHVAHRHQRHRQPHHEEEGLAIGDEHHHQAHDAGKESGNGEADGHAPVKPRARMARRRKEMAKAHHEAAAHDEEAAGDGEGGAHENGDEKPHRHHRHKAHEPPAEAGDSNNEDGGEGGEPATPAPTKKPRHHRHRRTPPPDDQFAPPVVVDDIVAYSVVVSNEEFIDGALTLAWSFKNHSKLFRDKKAHLVAIVAEGSVSDDSVNRLKQAGWTETLVLPDLTKQAPKAHWAATFNKLYLFNLTQYSRVAYFDVDMLMLRNPDSIFKTHLQSDQYIGALGNSHKAGKRAYFQSGMMLIYPSSETANWMFSEFRTNPYHKSVNGRDGKIIRDFYKDRYVNLDDMLSAHLGVHEPLDNVIGFHFRGSWKPWFDREHPPTEPDKWQVTKAPQPLQEMGEAYRRWWATYEDMHRMVFAKHDPKTETYNPSIQMWLMRHTKQSYVQMLSEVDVQRRNLTLSRLTLEKSRPGESCDFVCALSQGVCSHDALSFSEINNCGRLRQHFGCRTCTMDHPGQDQPSYDDTTKHCGINPMYYKNMRPNCSAIHPHSRRLCPCVPVDAINEQPVAFSVWGLPKPKENSAHEEGVTVDPKDNHAESGCFPSHTDYYADGGDHKCTEYLSNPDNVEYVTPLGTTLWVGRTAKLMFHYKEQGIRAIVKFPQRSFPHEAQSEAVAYAVDREAGVNRVPPTAFVAVPRTLLEAGFGNVTGDASHEASTAEFVKKEVWSLIDNDPKLSETSETGTRVGVSVQLWVEDVHRLLDTTLSVPHKKYLSWLGPEAEKHAPPPKKDVDGNAAEGFTVNHNTSRAELSRMMVFDFLIGNDDRSIGKNCYVAGGCRRHCHASSLALHDGASRIVLIDQGRSMYFERNPTGNPITEWAHGLKKTTKKDEKEGGDSEEGKGDENGDAEKPLQPVCRYPHDLYAKLSELGMTAGEGKGADGSDKDLSVVVMKRVGRKVVDVIKEEQFAHLQRRLETLLDLIKTECLAKEDEATVLSLPSG